MPAISPDLLRAGWMARGTASHDAKLACVVERPHDFLLALHRLLDHGTIKIAAAAQRLDDGFGALPAWLEEAENVRRAAADVAAV